MAKPNSEPISSAIGAAFELVFGRKPHTGEQSALPPALTQAINQNAALFDALLQLRRAQQLPEHESLRELLQSPMTAALQAVDHLDEATYEAAYATTLRDQDALIIGQHEYLPQHKERFRELFNACTQLLAGRSEPKLLEFGASEFSAFYKQFIPSLTFHLSDRPTSHDYIGFTEQVGMRRLGCDAYFALDLEKPGEFCAGGRPHLGDYDLIVFAEVLEHLVVNPVDLLSALLALLKPDGCLYLTTPNLFRAENREKWLALENPQQVFPAADGNWDRHHHHREYGAAELLRFAQQAGGKVVAFYYSNCWDQNAELADDERGNLVFLITPASSTDAQNEQERLAAPKTA